MRAANKLSRWVQDKFTFAALRCQSFSRRKEWLFPMSRQKFVIRAADGILLTAEMRASLIA
jgi:hypothetical protein